LRTGRDDVDKHLLNMSGNRGDMIKKSALTLAREKFGDLAPKFASLTDSVLFDDIWERKELSKRDRSLITVTALVALYRTEQLDFHLDLAVKNGVTKAELVEAVTHLVFYCGWPSAMSAVTRIETLAVT
jgi:4-carboxymuconolactone decarboxylase